MKHPVQRLPDGKTKPLDLRWHSNKLIEYIKKERDGTICTIIVNKISHTEFHLDFITQSHYTEEQMISTIWNTLLKFSCHLSSIAFLKHPNVNKVTAT